MAAYVPTVPQQLSNLGPFFFFFCHQNKAEKLVVAFWRWAVGRVDARQGTRKWDPKAHVRGPFWKSFPERKWQTGLLGSKTASFPKSTQRGKALQIRRHLKAKVLLRGQPGCASWEAVARGPTSHLRGLPASSSPTPGGCEVPKYRDGCAGHGARFPGQGPSGGGSEGRGEPEWRGDFWGER